MTSSASRILHRNLGATPPTAVGGHGVWLTGADGREILDGSGGAAVSCLGHQHPRVIEALGRQAGKLTYAHTAFFTSEAAEELADVLVGHEPGGLAYAYLVSGGSEAMESCLKLARQYFLEIGEPGRDRFIARRQSYHGNTLGALATGGNAWRRAPYAPLLSDAFSHVSPAFAYRERRDEESEAEFVVRLAEEIEAEFQRLGPDRVAAFVAEPIVGATAGVVPAPDGYFRAVREICDRHGALLILDEVMCGMGRTGTLHAWEQEGISPDIQAIAKGLGGGYQPIGAMLASARIVDAIRQGSGAFLHGHTYLAHPMACAAALEVQRVIAEDDLLPRVRAMGALLEQRLTERLGNHRHVGDIRGRGPVPRHRTRGRPGQQGAVRPRPEAQRSHQGRRPRARPRLLPGRGHGRRAPGRPRPRRAALHHRARGDRHAGRPARGCDRRIHPGPDPLGDSTMKRLLLALGLAAAGAASADAATLDTVKSRGQLVCGVSTGFAGFSAPDSQGNYKGLDADYCRALAAAVLGDATKVRFVALTAQNRFTALQSGEIDVLYRNSTQTFVRDVTIGLHQGPINFYDGQGFAVRKDSGVEKVAGLNGATICVAQGTTHEVTLGDYGRANKIDWKAVVYERPDTMYQAFFSGRCDAMTQDSSALAGAVGTAAPNPADYAVLAETISKEPLGPFTRKGDEVWSDIVTWLHYGLLEAEENGVTAANADEQAKGQNPVVQRLLGATGEFGQRFALDKGWMLAAIKAVGNYGEIFERNVGATSQLKLKRGLNGLWSKGGLMYAVPFR